jgi:UDP-N-acetylglucosamine--N-acetylmuramyl-(pentapeptide) pyrophosphoryl-undecaprenol N-acetylglucosamine transferase
LQARYHAYPYLHAAMGAAMAAADLVICRAGASILGELPYFGLPALLVPYPYAWRYQKVNAGWLTDRGAAMIVADGDLETQLLPTTLDLLADESRRSAMAAAARALAQPEAARRLAEMLTALGAGR